MKEHCCKIQCGKPAEFEVQSVRRASSGNNQFAGPDPHSDYTYACMDHVGEMLGYQLDAQNPEEIFWEVRRFNGA